VKPVNSEINIRIDHRKVPYRDKVIRFAYDKSPAIKILFLLWLSSFIMSITAESELQVTKYPKWYQETLTCNAVQHPNVMENHSHATNVTQAVIPTIYVFFSYIMTEGITVCYDCLTNWIIPNTVSFIYFSLSTLWHYAYELSLTGQTFITYWDKYILWPFIYNPFLSGMVPLIRILSIFVGTGLICYIIIGACVKFTKFLPNALFIQTDLQENPNGLLTISDTAHVEPYQPGEGLLIPTLGTRGDQVPMHWYGRLAAHLGVRTHIWNVHTATWDELVELQNGNPRSLIEGYVDLRLAAWQNYKYCFQPHVDPAGTGCSYSLSPPNTWIHPIEYQKHIKNLISQFLELLASTFTPSMIIGSLSGCDLPRSADGKTLLRKIPNKGKPGSSCWISGSAAKETIPVEIREDPAIVEIVQPYDWKVFSEYENVHTFGGAGTVQTIIACGAKPIIHNNLMDRNYRKIPQPTDFSQPSILPFIGLLQFQGFNPQVKPWIKPLALLSFFWSQRTRFITKNLIHIARLYSFVYMIFRFHYLSIALIISFPILLDYSQTVNGRKRFLQLLSSLYRFPILMCVNTWGSLIFALLAINQTFEKILFEINNWKKKRTSLLIRKVKNFPLPFGHFILRDNTNGDEFEGGFIGTHEFYNRFKWMAYPFRDWQGDYIEIPLPFIPAILKKMIENHQTRPYTAFFNCHTLVIQEAWDYSFFSMIPLLFIFFCSLSILVPGQIGTWLCTKYNIKLFGVDLRRTIFPELAMAAPPVTITEITSGETKEIDQILTSDDIVTRKDETIVQFSEHEDTLLEEEEREKLIKAGVPDTEIPTTKEELHRKEKEHTEKFEELDEVLAQTMTLYHLAIEGGMTEDQAAHAAIMTIKEMLLKTPSPDLLKEDLSLGRNHRKSKRKTKWAIFLDYLHQATKPIDDVPFVQNFVRWVNERKGRMMQFIVNFYLCLQFIAQMLYTMFYEMWKLLFIGVSIITDHLFNQKKAKRIKSAWALSGLTKTPRLSAKARLEMEIALSSFSGRNDFLHDYKNFCEDLRRAGSSVGAKNGSRIGSRQHRSVTWSKPVMSRQEAEALGFEEGEYIYDPVYQKRINSYALGDKQGADCVYFGEKNPERIRRSIERYAPSYEPISSDDRDLAVQIADAIVEEYPDMMTNCEITPLRAVLAYIKEKYSPGSPFIGVFKSRQAMFDAGWDEALMENARAKLLEGKYPVQFYHAFVKSQVVNIDKVVNHNKNLRTVVAQDLASYFIDQCIQIERNKRINWRETGAGMGMVLNQNMQHLFLELEKVRKQGGQYFIADAHEMDARTKPFLWEGLGRLAQRGFEHKPNGAAFSSVLTAKYDSMQQSYIFGITEGEYDGMTIGIPNKLTRAKLCSKYPTKFVDWDEIEPNQVKTYSDHFILVDDIRKIYNSDNPEKPTLKINFPFYSYFTTDKTFVPSKSPVFSEPLAQKMQNVMLLETEEELISLVHETYNKRHILYNQHFKNRGGGTGQSATSWDNTWGYKICLIAGWCRYHEYSKTPKDFFRENRLFNTGDDSGWAVKMKRKNLDIEKMKEAMAYYGIELDLELVANITDVEYLGKMCRTPTKDDALTLRKWRNAQMFYAQQRGITIEKPKFPKYVVYQNADQILMRRSALRYYQAAGKNHTFLFSSIQRSVGHAMITAFSPQLYKIFAQEYKEDVLRLAQWMGFKHDEVQVKLQSDQFGMPNVVLTYPGQGKKNIRDLLKLSWKKTPHEIIEEAQKTRNNNNKRQAFRYFIFQNKFPSYYSVVNIHMKPEKRDPEEHHKFMQKLFKKSNAPDEFIRVSLDIISEWISDMPRQIYKMQPNLLSLYPDPTWYTFNKYVEKFIWCVHRKQIDTISAFQSLCNQSPYGACTDAATFFQEMQDPEVEEEVYRHPAYAYGNMCVLTTLLYGMLYPIEVMIVQLRYIGWVYRLFMFYMLDLPKTYSVLNLAYWHSEAQSSAEVSAIMPKDPYIQMKRFSCCIIDFLPIWFGYIFRFDLIVKLLPPLIEWFATIIRKGNTFKETRNDTFINPWDNVINGSRFKNSVNSNRITVISSPTGTGKSSLLPASLLSFKSSFTNILPTSTSKIWILFPRQILRDEWSSPLIANDSQSGKRWAQIVKRQVKPADSASIYLCTYGHFLNRLQSKNHDYSNDLIIMDEFHELDTIQISVIDQIKDHCRIFLMSATPVKLPSIEPSFFDSQLPKRFGIKKIIRDDTPTNNYMWALENYPEHAKSCIIRVSSYPEVTRVRESLHYNNILTQEVSKRTAGQPITKDESTVLVCTQIIDAGISIPGRRMLISNGETVVNDHGQVTRGMPTSAMQETQISGRIGRYQEGDIYITNSKAGTGATYQSYSGGHYFQSKIAAKYINLPKLANIYTDFATQVKPSEWQLYPEMPYFAVDKSLPTNTRNNIALLHYIIMSGVEMDQMKNTYVGLQQGKVPEWLEHLQDFRQRYHILSENFDAIFQYLQPKHVLYAFEYVEDDQQPPKAEPFSEHDKKVMYERKANTKFLVQCLPLKPIKQVWQTNVSKKDEHVLPIPVKGSSTLAKSYEQILHHSQQKMKMEWQEALGSLQEIIYSDKSSTLKEEQMRRKIKSLSIRIKLLDRSLKRLKQQPLHKKPESQQYEVYSAIVTDINGHEIEEVIENGHYCSHCFATHSHTHTLREELFNQETGLRQQWFFYKIKPIN